MLLGGLYNQNNIRWSIAISRILWLSQLRAIVDLLLYNSDRIIRLKTIEIKIFICIKTFIYLIENLPSYVPVYLLFLVLILLVCHAWHVLLVLIIVSLISLRISVFDIKILVVLASDSLKLMNN